MAHLLVNDGLKTPGTSSPSIMPPATSTLTTAADDCEQARQYLDSLFRTSDPQASCLSIVPHSLRDTRDLRSHFFGCLGYEKRVNVLDDESHPIWEEMKELEALDSGTSEPNISTGAGPSAPSIRYISALNLQAELKRIAVLRRTPALKSSVRELRNSVKEWVFTNKEDIQDIHDRRRVDSHTFGETHKEATPSRPRRATMNTARLQRPPTFSRFESAIPEYEDILPEFSKKVRDIVEAGRDKNSQPKPDLEAPSYDLKRDIKARLIKLKRPTQPVSQSSPLMANVMIPENEQVDDEIFKGTFPDQQVSVYWLLKDKFKKVHGENLPLEERMRTEELRYFHIPANNMSVSFTGVLCPSRKELTFMHSGLRYANDSSSIRSWLQ